jgi:hypothetical protein
VFGSVGEGVGWNISGDIFVGYIKENICLVEGHTVNINIGIGPFSLTLMFAPQEGELKFIGSTIGFGNFFPGAGASVTHSYTETYSTASE